MHDPAETTTVQEESLLTSCLCLLRLSGGQHRSREQRSHEADHSQPAL